MVETKITKKRKQSGFKDFQYEVPGLQNKRRREESEVIDIASSDDEEPIKGCSKSDLPSKVSV